MEAALLSMGLAFWFAYTLSLLQLGFNLPFCLRLANGSCGGVGFADCIYNRILFSPHTGIFQP